MIPEKIGRYEIKQELGRGGMATVYLAYDPRFEREVAVKLLPSEMLHDPQFRVRFEREAKTIAMLEHPAIVPVYDFGEENGQPFFVMRFMGGGSLSDRIKQGPLSLQTAAEIMERLAPALDDAHARGIIHRDLKPGNILYDKRGDTYISDFGIAKLTEGGSNVTGSAVIGTPAYMSPEQAKGETIDSRADIYALGVILFEMLSGRQPYEADTPMGVVIKHITDPVTHILAVNPNLPPAIDTVLEKAMAKNRNDRFATAAELSAALSEVANKEKPELPASTRISKPQSLPVSNATMVQNHPPKVPIKNVTNKWVPIGIIGFLLVIGIAALIFGAKLILPMFTRQATNTPVAVLSTSTSEVFLPTSTVVAPVVAPTVTLPISTPTTPDVVSTPQTIPVIGGADQVAFLANKDVFIMNVDGSNLQQITKDGTIKTNLQWLPSGTEMLYISGKCVRILEIATGKITDLTCFLYAETLDAFEVSPDGSQVAISLDHVLYVVPFNLETLKNAHDHPDLVAMKGCITGFKTILTPITSAHWSRDGLKLALGIWGVDAGRQVDMVRVVDISNCDAVNLSTLDEFPATFFTMDAYDKNPIIPSFNWDRQSLFVMNSVFFNGNFGPLYQYNMRTHKAGKINPIDGACCYLDANWSPDGTYLIFAFSDFRKGDSSYTELYYIPFGSVGTGANYTPIPLPAGLFKDTREAPHPILRPGK